MTPRRPCAVDLGSGTCGLVAAVLDDAGALSVSFAGAMAVDKLDVVTVTEAILGIVITHGCDALILEVGSLFGQETIQGTVATGNALAICREIVGGLALECRRRGIPVHRIGRRSWSARLVPGVKGGVSNAAAAAAAVAGLDAASLVWMTDDGGQHKRDALGALRGWLLLDAARDEKAARPPREPRAPRESKPRGPRKPLEGTAAEAMRAYKAAWARAHAKVKACGCPRKHRKTCALFVAPQPRGLTCDGIARAERALTGLF